MQLAGANVLVVGLARSGLATLELLGAHGARPHATDMKTLEQLPEAARRLSEWGVAFSVQGPEAFENRDLIVVSPGVPWDLPELTEARRRGIAVIGEVELAASFLQGKTIGITGSNGKTTTTALTGHILREAGLAVQVGGNIGTPPTALVASSRPDQWNVLELSSFQLESISHFRADVGVALNITPDHLDRHYTMEAYTAAKRRLFEKQQPGDFAVLNADDPTCRGYAEATAARAVWFSSQRAVTPGLWLDGRRICFDGAFLLDAGDIPLRGRHNVENVMAAAAAARIAGVPLERIAGAVRDFPGVEHRLEFVRSASGVDFYNDSKATNVDATLKAIDAFPGRLWIILGGKDKDSDYRTLRAPLAVKGRAALLIGAAASKIGAHLGDAVRSVECGTLAAAVDLAYREAVPGDTVLLAPACASFDQFEDFEHRGRAFKSAVAELKEKN